MRTVAHLLNRHAPRIDSKAIEAVLTTFEKTFPGASQHPATQFFDSGPLEAVERSGFIQELGK